MEIKNIYNALKAAPTDENVKIKIAHIVQGKQIGYHVAEIGQQVQAHVHKSGDEIYHVLKGSGLMYIGKVVFEDNRPVKTNWEQPVSVKENDVFNIPEGYAHSLRNSGSEPLLISFCCPVAHLTEDDRFIVDNPT